MKLSDEQKRIKRMRKSYNTARKQIADAMKETRAGTAVHLQYVKALAELDTKERAEEIALGLAPQNLGALVATEFLYVSHVPVCPANRAELEKILGAQIVKACTGLNYSEADEAMREQLQGEYK
jgi:hypothetical protein